MTILTEITSLASAIRSKASSLDTFKLSEIASCVNTIETDSYDYASYDEIVNKTVSSCFESVDAVGDVAFAHCYALTTISFPQCSIIGAHAFQYCSALTAASFPQCTSIGTSAFYNCTALATASFPQCTSIGTNAFVYCSALTTASFPLCTRIRASAFRYCTRLAAVSFPQCTLIDDYAFAYCSALTTASFPKCSVIGKYAFRDCSKLGSLYLMSTTFVSLSHSNAFTNTKLSAGGTGKIYVPNSMLATYKTKANWSKLSARLVGA